MTDSRLPAGTQVGAAQRTSLVVAALEAVPRVPELVDHVKLSALPWASCARTRKTTVPSATGMVATDWKASTTSGGKWPVVGAPTWMVSVPE
ncbi:hypothetical protein D7V88_42320, partial [Corallococcus terminator]